MESTGNSFELFDGYNDVPSSAFADYDGILSPFETSYDNNYMALNFPIPDAPLDTTATITPADDSNMQYPGVSDTIQSPGALDIDAMIADVMAYQNQLDQAIDHSEQTGEPIPQEHLAYVEDDELIPGMKNILREYGMGVDPIVPETQELQSNTVDKGKKRSYSEANTENDENIFTPRKQQRTLPRDTSPLFLPESPIEGASTFSHSSEQPVYQWQTNEAGPSNWNTQPAPAPALAPPPPPTVYIPTHAKVIYRGRPGPYMWSPDVARAVMATLPGSAPLSQIQPPPPPVSLPPVPAGHPIDWDAFGSFPCPYSLACPHRFTKESTIARIRDHQEACHKERFTNVDGRGHQCDLNMRDGNRCQKKDGSRWFFTNTTAWARHFRESAMHMDSRKSCAK